jgi:pilus assembly protein CpaB
MKAARLVVLGVALLAGGIAAFLVAGGEEEKKEVVAAPPPPVVQFETVDVLIAKSDIGMGVAVSPQDLDWQAWPAATTGASYVTRKDRPSAIEDFTGSITRAPFTAGEPIREAKLIKANGAAGFMAAILPSGMRAVSTEISPETGAGGFILPNDRVDVILTKRPNRDAADKQGETANSETILINVRVLAIDQTVEEKNGQRVVVGKTATLELLPRQAETLALARQLGILSLALRSLLDASKTEPVADDKNERKTGINTVRYGVSTTSK